MPLKIPEQGWLLDWTERKKDESLRTCLVKEKVDDSWSEVLARKFRPSTVAVEKRSTDSFNICCRTVFRKALTQWLNKAYRPSCETSETCNIYQSRAYAPAVIHTMRKEHHRWHVNEPTSHVSVSFLLRGCKVALKLCNGCSSRTCTQTHL